jgi:tetratricopeptide (TPR) repeat protein
VKAHRSLKKKASWVRNLLLITPLMIALPFAVVYGLFTMYRMQGDRFSAQKQWTEAIAAYETALRMNSHSAITYLKLAQVQQQQGHLLEALSSSNKAFIVNPDLAPDPDLAAALKSLGDRLHQKNYLDEAIISYERAIHLEPFYLDAYFSLGHLFVQQKQWDEASRAYEKIIDIDSENLAAYLALGNIYRQQEDWAKAQTVYEQAWELKPYDAKISQYLGQTYHELGLTHRAIELYLQAIALDPKNGELYNLLGEAFYEQKDIFKATAAYEQALQLSPKNATIYKNLCLSQLNQRQFEEALKHCRQASKLDPGLVEARVYAAELERGLAIRNNPDILEMPEPIPSLNSDRLVLLKRSIVKIFARGQGFNGIGTGWIVKRDRNKAWIVTNRHVVTDTEDTQQKADRISVEFYSTPSPGQIRRRQTAKIVQIAPPQDWIDLAILEVSDPPSDIKPFSLASTDSVANLPVRVIGNPVVKGDWVLAKGTVIQVTERQMSIAISIASGFSGSPVLTPQNRVIGLISQAGLYCPNTPPPKNLKASLSLGCGLAIPIEQVKERLQLWGIL